MTWLVENPWPILMMGILTEAILFGGWVQTGQRAIVYLMIGALFLFGGLLLVERFVVTEVEAVEMTLEAVASDLERNDVQAVLSRISSSATEMRHSAESQMPRVEISKVSIHRNLKITIHPQTARPTATAEFNAVIIGSDRRGAIENGRYARFFVVRLRKEGDRWVMTDYEDHDPLQMN